MYTKIKIKWGNAIDSYTIAHSYLVYTANDTGKQYVAICIMSVAIVLQKHCKYTGT